MANKLSIPSDRDIKPRIVVIGVGGAGGNAVNNMITAGLEGVEFIVANTDAQALENSKAKKCIQIGTKITQGLGAGADSEIGRESAKEALPEIMDTLHNAHMVFITAGMGGGTGTGAAPVIARAAREHGILTVGVVAKPFSFEGSQRMRTADAGIEVLAQDVDTLIVIPNQNLFNLVNQDTPMSEAFALVDEVLHSGVASITDLMIKPGIINLDFADVCAVMRSMGKAMIGTGEAEGDNRGRTAAEIAIANPLLDTNSMRGAQGVLINITGGSDMTLYEVEEASNIIKEEVDNEANIIIGSALDESLEGVLRVSVVATGIGIAEADDKIVSLAPIASVDNAMPLAPLPTESAPTPEVAAMPESLESEGYIPMTAPSFVPMAAAPPMTAPITQELPMGDTSAASETIAPPKDAAVPPFMTGSSAPEVMAEIPLRTRSFLDKVLGRNLEEGDTEEIAAATEEQEAPQEEASKDAPPMALEAETETEIETEEETSEEDTQEDTQEENVSVAFTAPLSVPIDDAVVTPQVSITSAPSIPMSPAASLDPKMEAAPETTEVEIAESDSPAPVEEAIEEAIVETPAAPMMESPEVVVAESTPILTPPLAPSLTPSLTPTMESPESTLDTTPAVESVSAIAEPVVQTQIESPPIMGSDASVSVSSGSSLSGADAPQLDIPSFLRR